MKTNQHILKIKQHIFTCRWRYRRMLLELPKDNFKWVIGISNFIQNYTLGAAECNPFLHFKLGQPIQMLKCQEVNKTDLHLHLRSPGTFTPSWAQIYRSKIQFFFFKWDWKFTIINRKAIFFLGKFWGSNDFTHWTYSAINHSAT